MSKPIYTNEVYSNFLEARRLPMNVVDYLYKNSENLWKLLYYPQSTLGQPNVSNSNKAKMISKVSSVDQSAFQVFFDTYTTDAMVSANAQLRISVLEIKPINRTNAIVEIIIQCIVNNKASVIQTDTIPVENKAFAIAQEVVQALNGTEIEGLKGSLWLDKSQDGKTGIYKRGFSDNFSGYELIMSAYI